VNPTSSVEEPVVNAPPPAAVTSAPDLTRPMRDPTPLELGHRIKMLRVSRGLTLKDLEARGGISATHVSEIERGKASPTVGALGRIAHALGLRPATLVEPMTSPDYTVTRRDARGESSVQWGLATMEAVTEPAACTRLGAHLITLPIGREPSLQHRHDGEEWVTVLEGVAEIRVGEAAFVLREGDSLHFRAHESHAYSNLASNPAVLLVATLPRITL
jgi:transcriptional regulator with XRE-family HTH domain